MVPLPIGFVHFCLGPQFGSQNGKKQESTMGIGTSHEEITRNCWNVPRYPKIQKINKCMFFCLDLIAPRPEPEKSLPLKRKLWFNTMYGFHLSFFRVLCWNCHEFSNKCIVRKCWRSATWKPVKVGSSMSVFLLSVTGCHWYTRKNTTEMTNYTQLVVSTRLKHESNWIISLSTGENQTYFKQPPV